MTFRSTQTADSKFQLKKLTNRISGVLVIISVLASNRVDCGFEPWSGQIKDYKISICYVSAKIAALRRKKAKAWLAWNQDNGSEWSNIYACGLNLFKMS